MLSAHKDTSPYACTLLNKSCIWISIRIDSVLFIKLVRTHFKLTEHVDLLMNALKYPTTQKKKDVLKKISSERKNESKRRWSSIIRACFDNYTLYVFYIRRNKFSFNHQWLLAYWFLQLSRHSRIKHCWARLVLGWVIVLVC